jgi:carboxyl-terminal processing protease
MRMRDRLLPILLALILAVGVPVAPALAQPADIGIGLFLESYRTLREESLFLPSPETLLRGADAGLRGLLREEGQNPASLSALMVTGDERGDLEQFLYRIAQVQMLARARPTAVVYAAISGMVAALLDPNSAFFSPDALVQLNNRIRGEEFVGIGIVIEERAGGAAITEVLEESPAIESGLRAGDVILAVDGVPTAGLSLERVSQMIRGAEGSEVALTIQRLGATAPLSVTLVRRRIVQRVVATRVLASGIGYLRLSQFNQASSEMVASGLRELLDQGARGLVLDLRGNPGGLLDASVNIASHFLERGVVVTLESGRGGTTTYTVRPRAPKHTGPLVVLVDRGSASASEIVAGALQDAGIKLVGTRTYGKATVQAVYRLRDGSGLRLTVSRYLTPLGRDVEGRGLTPDLEVATGGALIGSPGDAPLNRAVAMLQQSASLVGVASR